jgi:hypothetical protein
MDRKLLLPVVAVTAWAQQTNPAAAEVEKAVRARAQEFFDLQVGKKYRQAESMVAEDSKDEYYNGHKFNFKSFKIQKVELSDQNTRASVTILAKVTLVMPQAAFDFDAPITTAWMVESGQWVLYFEHPTELRTPFGIIKPNTGDAKSTPFGMVGAGPSAAALQEPVKIDRKSVVLTAGGAPEMVAIANTLPGGVDLEVRSDPVSGLSADLEKKHLEAGEKTSLRFQATGDGGRKGVVHLLVSPIGVQLDIPVTIN